MNNKTLPFSGKKGTIKEIKEDGKKFIVERWGATPEDDTTILYVPNTEENYNALNKEYTDSLKACINKNSNKYEIYCRDIKTKRYSYKSLYYVMAASLLIIGASIPLLLTNDIRGLIGVQLSVYSFMAFGIATRFFIENKIEARKKKFISEHEEIVNECNHLENTRNREITDRKTHYSTLKSDKNPVKENNMVKVREREKTVN